MSLKVQHGSPSQPHMKTNNKSHTNGSADKVRTVFNEKKPEEVEKTKELDKSREYYIRSIMEEKKVPYDVAEAEVDFFS